MSYLNCPSCGLSIAQRGVQIEHCPRCLARRRIAVGLFISDQPQPTNGSGRRSVSTAEPGASIVPQDGQLAHRGHDGRIPDPTRLGIQTAREEDRYRLILAGEMDMASAPNLEALVRGLCADGAREIVLDLGRLEFIDSSGMRTILHCMKLCEEHRCDFWLIRGGNTVQRVFEVSGLLDKLPFRELDPATSKAL